MKVYFVIIIVVLVVVIGLLFYLLFKIYSLHIKAEEGTPDEEQALNGDSIHDKFSDKSEKSSLSSDRGSSQLDFVDGKMIATVQPDIKNLMGPNINQPRFKKTSNGIKSMITISFGYSIERTALKVAILEVSYLPKGKPGSSEAYVDLQVSPHRHRTYRNPGFRRPLRGFLNKPVDFRLEEQDIAVHYLFAFFLRYDPFSRLKIDGEVCVKLADLDQQALLAGEPVIVRQELQISQQEFTAFIFRLR